MRYASDHRAGRTPSQRQLRVGEAIRHVLATLLARGELRDPVLQGASITVSEVRISPDLKNATVFVLHFQTDTSVDEADRIDQLLHSEKVARDLRTEPGDGEDGDGA